LFAALETATGKITADACYPRHRHQEFLTFLQKVAATHPGLDLHVVLDNYGTRKHPEIRRWLARPENQRITLHLTPTSCSWLSMVEVFGIITRQTIGRGSFGPVRELTDAIGALIDGCQPFTWIKDADQLLASKKLTPIFAAGSYPPAGWVASGRGWSASGLCAGILCDSSAAGGHVMG
jgi:hypothetical protein